MLDNRRQSKFGFYVLESDDYFYSLCYHALFHKRKLSEEYRKKLSNMYGEDLSPEQLLELLKKFM